MIRSLPRVIATALALAMLVPAFPSAHADIALPAPVERTLGNGLRVVVFPSSRQSLVQVQLRVPAGLVSEPAGREGIAWCTAEMLRHGTTSRDAATFAADVDRTGGTLVPSVGRDFATLGGTFLSRDFETVLELTSDAVLDPIFDPAEFARVQAQAVRQLTLPRASADEDAVREAVFGDHAYGRPVLGRLATLSSLDAGQVRAFWNDTWHPDRAVLAIAGDVTPERAFAVAEEWLGRWSGNAVAPKPAAVPMPSRVTVRIVDVPSARTELRIAFPGPPRGAPDEPALLAANALFGGAPSTRPGGERLRFGREVRTSYVPLQAAGLFSAALSAPSDSAADAVRALTGMLRALQTPPSDAHLAEVRNVLRQGLPMSLETLASWTGAWLAADQSGDAKAFFEGYDDRIQAVTSSAVAAAAARWLDPAKATIVAVGPAARLKPQLESFGAVTVVRPSRADTTAAAPAPASAAEPKKPATGTSAQRTRGKDVIRRATVAHGGLTKLKAVRDSRVESTVTLEVNGQKLEGTLMQARREPEEMISVTDLAGVSMRQTLSNGRAWQYTGSDSVARDLDPQGLAALRSGFWSDVVHLLLAANDSKSVVFDRGKVTVRGVSADAIVVRTPDQIERVVYVHPTTRRILAFDQGESSGVLARRVFSDYRGVGGVMWPHHEERLLNGETVMTVDVRSVRFNTGIPESAFSR